MKTIRFIFFALSVIVLTVYSCKKDDNSPSNPTNGKTMVVFNPDLNYGTLTDTDGNEYKTIKIGNQTWMAENLRTFKYNDGTSIPNIKANSEWSDLTSASYCTFKNTTKNDSIATYGCLYNWYAVNSGKLAPEGWHVPTNQDWQTLDSYLIANGYNYDGTTSGDKIAKALASTYGWITPFGTGYPGSSDHQEYANKSGFSAVPGGLRVAGSGECYSIGEIARYWSATSLNNSNAYSLSITNSSVNLISGTSHINMGYSVRLIKD